MRVVTCAVVHKTDVLSSSGKNLDINIYEQLSTVWMGPPLSNRANTLPQAADFKQ